MKIAILTTFHEFNPGYSLTGIVKDQALMLTRFGHEVSIVVAKGYHGEKLDYPLLTILPDDIPLIDYACLNDLSTEHHLMSDRVAEVLTQELADMDVVLTHDVLLTGWNLPYFVGLTKVTGLKCSWFHGFMSLPTKRWPESE